MEIAIISGKGGTGKSSISAALATAGQQVVIADCDVDAANLYLLFNPTVESEDVFISGHKAVIDYTLCSNCGKCLDYCRFDAISQHKDQVVISEISCDGCFLCSRICPEQAISMPANDKSRMYSGLFRNGQMVYGRLSPGEENSGKLVSMVREKAREQSQKSGLALIILDGPPGIGCPVISTITGVDKLILVTEPSISGLSDLARAYEITEKFSSTVYVIINKSDINLSMSDEIAAYCRAHNIADPLRLPFDSRMTEAMVHGQSIIEYDSENLISRELIKMFNQLIKEKI